MHAARDRRNLLKQAGMTVGLSAAVAFASPRARAVAPVTHVYRAAPAASASASRVALGSCQDLSLREAASGKNHAQGR
jgi:hypothetical protein